MTENRTRADLLERAKSLRRHAERLRALQGRDPDNRSREPQGIGRLLAEAQDLERQAEQLKSS